MKSRVRCDIILEDLQATFLKDAEAREQLIHVEIWGCSQLETRLDIKPMAFWNSGLLKSMQA